jgi:flagellar protein FlaG
MSVQIGHLQLVDPPAAPVAAAAVRPADAAPATAAVHAVTADVMPASPPHDVQAEVAQAHERAQQLAESNRELHFAKDPDTGRIIVQVRDLDGKVLRTIPPSHALAVMSGELEL